MGAPCGGLVRGVIRAAAGIALVSCLWAAPLPLRVDGTALVRGDGRPVHLRGVNCAGMEWSSTGDGRILTTVGVATRDWHANLIRLPLSQDRWFGRAPEQDDGGAGYRALVARLVALCEANDAYIVLDLHWSDAGDWGRNIGQHNLPDANSVAFWRDAAPAFKDSPAVMFDLYNEPAHINWDQWFKGGTVAETDEKTGAVLTYQAVGLPALAAAIRSTGARNVIIAGGINWGYELGGILEGRQLSDARGNGIVYAAHPYPHKYPGIGRETIAQWAARMEPLARKLPIIVSEFGSIEAWWPFPKEWNYSDERWNREMIRVLEAHHWNWAAWDFNPTAQPCLISDWNYTPTPHFGVWVRQALARNPGE